MASAVRKRREVNASAQPASFYFLFTLGPQLWTGTISTQGGPSLLPKSCLEMPSQTCASLVEDDH